MPEYAATGWITHTEGGWYVLGRTSAAQESSSLGFGVRIVLPPELEAPADRAHPVHVVGDLVEGVLRAQSISGARLADAFVPTSVVTTVEGAAEHPKDINEWLANVDRLAASGDVTSSRVVRNQHRRWVLVVATPHPERAAAELRGSPDWLVIQPVPWSAADLSRALGHLGRKIEDWGLSAIVQAVDSRGADRIVVTPREVTDDLRDWLQSLPDGLVEARPVLTPT